MIPKIILSALVGHLSGCTISSIYMIEGFDMGAVMVAAIWSLPILAMGFKYTGIPGISSMLVALIQLPITCLIGKKKQLPWFIYAGCFIFFLIFSFWGGTLAIESAMR